MICGSLTPSRAIDKQGPLALPLRAMTKHSSKPCLYVPGRRKRHHQNRDRKRHEATDRRFFDPQLRPVGPVAKPNSPYTSPTSTAMKNTPAACALGVW